MKDYARIQQAETQTQVDQWERWLAANRLLTAKILAERGGEPVDVDVILESNRADIEERHDYLFDN